LAVNEVFGEGVRTDFLHARYRLFEIQLDQLSRYEISHGDVGPLIVLRSDSDGEVMRWGQMASVVDEIVAPANHYSLCQGGSLATIREVLRRVLDRSALEEGEC